MNTITLKYIVIGCTKAAYPDFTPIRVSPKEIIDLYGVNRDECLEYDHISEHYRLVTPLNKFIVLKYRPKGDYKEYLRILKTKYLLENS